MATRAEAVRPARAVPPGEVLRAELEAREWTQAELAGIMGRPPAALNQIIGGKKQITAETAAELGRALGTSAELWLHLETAYRLSLAQGEQAAGRLGAIEQRRRLREVVPCLTELTRRRWVEPTDEPDALRAALLDYFQVPSLEELRSPDCAAAFRRSVGAGAAPVALLAWVRRAERLAAPQQVPAFSSAELAQAVPNLLACAAEAGDVARVPGLLRGLGVRFVIVPTLAGARIDGATILGEAGPIVALSLRFDRIDWFWFTLLHEVAHLVAGHTGDRVDELRGAPDDPDECEANRLAMDWLIPPDRLAAFRASLRPGASLAVVTEFARTLGRHPGIVVGRLHWEGLLPYTHLRGSLVKVSPYLA